MGGDCGEWVVTSEWEVTSEWVVTGEWEVAMCGGWAGTVW